MKTILIVAAALAIGVAVPFMFVRENPRLQAVVAKCMEQSDEEDPRIAAEVHFDHPLQRLLTLKTVVSGEENNYVYISGYILFGIELTRARSECGGGRVTTVKSYGFTHKLFKEGVSL